MRMLSAGPEVSFRGSPTVSPTTAALYCSEPFILSTPASSLIPNEEIYFLALSHAPPVLAEAVANITPETIAPGRNPASKTGPKMKPISKGDKMT